MKSETKEERARRIARVLETLDREMNAEVLADYAPERKSAAGGSLLEFWELLGCIFFRGIVLWACLKIILL